VALPREGPSQQAQQNKQDNDPASPHQALTGLFEAVADEAPYLPPDPPQEVEREQDKLHKYSGVLNQAKSGRS
jgi:hypothetical protein